MNCELYFSDFVRLSRNIVLVGFFEVFTDNLIDICYYTHNSITIDVFGSLQGLKCKRVPEMCKIFLGPGSIFSIPNALNLKTNVYPVVPCSTHVPGSCLSKSCNCTYHNDDPQSIMTTQY